VTDARPAAVIVLAAGEGKRMKSATPKVLHRMCGRTLLGHVLAAIEPLQPERLLVVLGHERPMVEKFLAEAAPHAQVVVQEEQLGTGHAARVALEAVPDLTGTVLVMHGDTPLFTTEHLDTPLDFDAAVKAGSMNGTSAVQIFDEDDCVVHAVLKWSEFFKHESCGKCTPCREGTYWYVGVYERLEAGLGTEEDIDTLVDLSDNILGRSFCALGDGATSSVTSSINYFRDEYLAHVEGQGCPFGGARELAGAH